jgi:hypothetical protein
METAYDGRQVVGMDLHRRRSVLVRMTEDGRRLGTARITNSPAERKAIAAAGKDLGEDPTRPFHPHDGRIVSLGLHHTIDTGIAHDVIIDAWWTHL